MKTIISLGAGVQSSTMALMAAKGEITPMPDCAIFADTQWEPKAVYDWLDWLEKQLPFPVYRVTAGSIRENLLSNTTGQRIAAVPWHMQMPNGDRAMGRRQCTSEYKIVPIERKVRELLGLAKGQRGPKEIAVEQWIGISLDEIQRMKDSSKHYIQHRWPLIEWRMTRSDCLLWMERNGYPKPEKSSCIGCPYHSDRQWRELRDTSPDEWADAVLVDGLIRNDNDKMLGTQYMHRSLVPLGAVDLSTAADHGQQDMFNNECDGICGV